MSEHFLEKLARRGLRVGPSKRLILDWVFGEVVKPARGKIAILGRGDHTRNMFGTSLHTAYCKQTTAFETAEIMHFPSTFES